VQLVVLEENVERVGFGQLQALPYDLLELLESEVGRDQEPANVVKIQTALELLLGLF